MTKHVLQTLLLCFVAWNNITHAHGKVVSPPVAPAPTTTTTPKIPSVIKQPDAKNPVVTIAKAKIMGDPLTEQEWLNLVFTQLSPRFAEFASGVLSEEIEPLVQKVLKTSHLPNVHFHFEKTDFGTIPPKITNMTTHRTPEGQVAKSITIDFDITYLGDCDLQVSLMGIRSGVRDVQLSGRGRIVLKPTVKSLPLIGGLQLCFLERPNINFDLDGIANIADWPVLRRKVRKEIRDDTAKKCVYPNRLIIPMSSSVDPMHIKCFEPTGLVAVKIASASGLPRKHGIRKMVGQDKPDVYIKVRVGAQVFRTKVVKNKVDPVWPESDPWYYFMLETPRGHRLRLDVFDEDSMSHDEFLGHVIVNVQDLLGAGDSAMVTKPLQDDPVENNVKKPVIVSGDITFSTKWLPLLPANASSISGSPVVVLTIFVYSANNLVEMTQGGGYMTDGDAPTTQLSVSVGQQVKTGGVIKRNLHPNFEECYTFLFNQNDGWQDDVANIQVLEVENGGNFGSYSLPMMELINNGIIQRRIVSILPEKPHITMTFSANLKMAA